MLLNDEHEKEMNPILNGIKTNYWPLWDKESFYVYVLENIMRKVNVT